MLPKETRLKASRDRPGHGRQRLQAPDRPRADQRVELRRPHPAVPARAEAPPRREPERRPGALPSERLPVILEVAPNADYALLDSGAGEKLEQYGPYRIVRPEGQAIWQRALPPAEWAKADAV